MKSMKAFKIIILMLTMVFTNACVSSKKAEAEKSKIISATKESAWFEITGPNNGISFSTKETSHTLEGTCSKNLNTLIATIGSVRNNCPLEGKWELTTGNLSNGENIINISTASSVDNQITKTITITVDTNAPDLTVKNPNSTGIMVTNQNTVNADGDCGRDVVMMTANKGTLINQCATQGKWSLVMGGLLEGENSFAVTAKDQVGNQVSKSLTVTLDTTPPILEINLPNGGGDYSLNSTTSQVISGNCSADTYSIYSNSGNISNNCSVLGSWSLSTGELTVGENVFTITSVDSLGNSVSRSIKVTSVLNSGGQSGGSDPIALEPWLLSYTGNGLISPLDPSVGRSCFNQDNSSKPLPNTNEAIITVDEEEHLDSSNNQMFVSRKCGHYFQYYAGKTFYTDIAGNKQSITSANCSSHTNEINLRKGYAPLPVMFRGTKSQMTGGIARFYWELHGPINGESSPLVKTSDAFNFSHIFETPGEYQVSLTVTNSQGVESTATTSVSVWARDKKIYYVDSDLGDDRYNGLAQSPQVGCDPAVASVGSCAGPWKTATRALSELGSPRVVSSYPNGKYSAENFCTSPLDTQVARYGAGWFKTYRSQSLISNMVLTLSKQDGSTFAFGPINARVCPSGSLVPTRTTLLSAGDQILFKRGQVFEMEPGIYSISSYTADIAPDSSTTACSPISGSSNVRCSYENIVCTSTASVGHWPKSVGIDIGAYGDSQLAKPKIQNVGTAACTFFDFGGVGQFNFSMHDLVFDMSSSKIPLLDDQARAARSVFLFSPTNGMNFSFNRIELSNFEQGIVLTNEHGVFLHNSKTFDSNIVHFYTGMASDVSLLNNEFLYSGNHLAYTGMRSAIVQNNIFSKPAFGRTALRIDGTGGLKNPNRYIWVSENKFLGWVDPRKSTMCLAGRCPFENGNRYNYVLVHFGPNTASDLANRDIVFTRNIVKDAETFMGIGNMENLTVKDNFFSTLATQGWGRISFAPAMITRPNRNILFKNNTFVEKGNPVNGSIIYNQNYNNPINSKCDDVPNNTGIKFLENSFYLTGKSKLFHYFAQRSSTSNGVTTIVNDLDVDQAEVEIKNSHTFKGNRIYSDNILPLFQVNGSANYAVGFQASGFNGLFSDGVDPLKYPFRIYNFDGAKSRFNLDESNTRLPATENFPNEPF